MLSHIIAAEFSNYEIPHQYKENYDEFKKIFKIDIMNLEFDATPFQFIMKKAPKIIHQTLRKTIMTEVPSVAIDKIYLCENGQLLEDCDASRILGLIPIDVDPNKLEDYGILPSTDENIGIFKADSCLYFKLHKTAINKTNVYSNDLKWTPLDEQLEKISTNDINIPEKIIINILLPGDVYTVNCLGIKGYGWDNAKYSPTSLACPKPKPVLIINDKISGSDANLLLSLYEKDVIKIRQNEAFVNDVWKIKRLNKNYLQYAALRDKIVTGQDDSEYMWSIESIRPKNQPAHYIFQMALDIIIEKCNHYLSCIEKLKPCIGSTEQFRKIDFKTHEKLISGKMRYIYLKGMDVTPNCPSFLFCGEISDSLSLTIVHLILDTFNMSVLCNAEKYNDCIMINCESLDKSISGISILEKGLQMTLQYFNHIKSVYVKELKKKL